MIYLSTFLIVILIGISLSMDAFSLSIIYGTYGLSKIEIIKLSIIVGLFHFFMPLLGLFFGNVILRCFLFNVNLVVSVIFFIIGISMIISGIKDEDVRIMVNIIGYLLFGLSVSIDSFSVGIGLGLISNNYLIVSCVFMIISGIFTYTGLSFGKILNKRLGKFSNIIGGIVMIMLAIYYYFKI